MPEQPTTLRGQIDAFFAILGATEFAGAQTTLEGWRTANENWNAIASLFPNATDRAAVEAAIGELRTNSENGAAATELFSILGVTDRAAAVARVNELGTQARAHADLNSLFASLGTNVSDVAAANAEITRLRTDFDTEVQRRIASTGLPAPVPKDKTKTDPDAKTMARSEFDQLSAADRMAFMRGGGRLTD